MYGITRVGFMGGIMTFEYYLELCQHYVATLYKFQNNLGDTYTLSNHLSNIRYEIIKEFGLSPEVVDNIFNDIAFIGVEARGDMTKYFKAMGSEVYRRLAAYKYNEFENCFKLKEKLNGDNIRINAQD